MKPKFPTKYIAFTQYFSSSHPAVDIPNKVTVNGTKYDNRPVYMTYDAKVITNAWASDYGYYTEYEYYIDGNRYVVGDGHFDKKSSLVVGQTYPQGTFISNMGNSGKSTAVHDHHRLSKNGTRVDPLKYEYVYPDQIVGSLEKAKLMYYTPEPTPPTPTDKIAVDGVWGPATTRKAQKVFGTYVDGIVSNQYAYYKNSNPGLLSSTFQWVNNPKTGSPLIKEIQKWCGVYADGFIGTNTIKAMQRKLGTPVDGKVSKPSVMVRAFQNWLNQQ